MGAILQAFHHFGHPSEKRRSNTPRSIQEILDQADELAKRFEDYEPDASDQRPVEEYMLERARSGAAAR